MSGGHHPTDGHIRNSLRPVFDIERFQGGNVLDDVSIPLAPNGQSSWFIDEAFTRTDTSDFAGSVRCSAPGEEMFTGVTVELDAGNRIFTTLPVVPVPERISQE